MNTIQIVIKSINPATLCIGFASVCVGCAASSILGYFEFLPSLLCLLYALLAQCSGNIVHRYYDEKFGYGENIRDGIISEDEEGRPIIFILLEAVKVFYTLTITIGLAIFIIAGWWTIIPGMIILLLQVLNNYGKQPWNHRVTYPLITFLFFGPISVISTCMVNLSAEHVSLLNWANIEPAIILSIVFGLMAMNSHIIYLASQSIINSRGYTYATGKCGIKSTSLVLTATSIIYSVLLGLTPYLIEISMSLVYLTLPLLSLLFSLYIIYLIYNKKRLNSTWILSLFNLLFVAIAIFITFWFSGYPNFAEFKDYEIITLL